MILCILFFILFSLFVLIRVKRNQEIELQILSVLLRYGEMYGLQIADALLQDFGKKAGWQALYPALRRLERQGFVTSRWGKERPEERAGARRKYYCRTGKRIPLQDVAKTLPFEASLKRSPLVDVQLLIPLTTCCAA